MNLPVTLTGSLLAALAALPLASGGDPSPPAPVRHCQIPCGIYGDTLRIDLLMEDAATIEKTMTTLHALETEEAPAKNQMVRWIVNKDEHAQAIQDQVAAYWLAQRIKVPEEKDREGQAKYAKQLSLLHRITVQAMKCKQTVDTQHVKNVRELALEFSKTYFTKKDLEHIRAHHAEKAG